MKKLELHHISGYLPYGLIGGHPEGHICKIGLNNAIFEGTGYVPVLRPESDLTKPIRHKGYNNGEEFVPIVEIGKLLGYKLERYEYDGEVEYGYSVTGWDDSQGYGFGWDMKSGAFGVWYDEIQDEHPTHLSFLLNVQAFDLLNSWLIDYRGLIPAGLAKSVYDLKENPYE